jgi:hypothetical protein
MSGVTVEIAPIGRPIQRPRAQSPGRREGFLLLEMMMVGRNGVREK